MKNKYYILEIIHCHLSSRMAAETFWKHFGSFTVIFNNVGPATLNVWSLQVFTTYVGATKKLEEQAWNNPEGL